MSSLIAALESTASFAPVLSSDKNYRKLDFTAANKDLASLNLTHTAEFSDYVFGNLLDDNNYIGVGGYDEPRVIYRRSAHFDGGEGEDRYVHLGVDLWAEALTPVHAPLAGIVHSVAFNDVFGDYGPTIILQHNLDGYVFHTLYGHLSLDSLQAMEVGKEVPAGTSFAAIGTYPENGNWPAHLHFQLITDLGKYRGNYPGVSSLSERPMYLSNCPDPNLILRIAELA